MSTPSTFIDRSMIFIFFVYGLAFFSMGLAVWLESGRTSGFQTGRMLRFLAGFGIFHGLHEWIEIFTRLHAAGMIELGDPQLVNVVDVAVLTLSFLLLLTFGLRMIYSYRDGDGRSRTMLTVTLFALIWGAGTAVSLAYFKPCPESCLTAADVLSRYILGIPGALLAAWALLLQRRAFQERGMGRCAQDMRWAALTLFLYGVIGQLFTKPSALFPSTIINSDLFLQMFGFPVQIFRAAAACIIAVFIIRALRGFEMERQQGLARANAARLAAQQEALATQQRVRAEIEKLNQELQTAVQDLTMLFELSQSLATTLELDTLLTNTLAQVLESVPRIEGGMIFMRQKQGRPLERKVCMGYGGQNGASAIQTITRQAQAVGEYVVKAGQPACWSGDIIIPLHELAHQTEQGAAGHGALIVAMPLAVQDWVAGSLVLTMSAGAAPFTQHDLSLIGVIASQLSMAIENATLYQEVQTREELRGELLHQVVSAQEMERQRIARELHDGPGQMLTALGLGLAAASESIIRDPERGAFQLSELKTMNTKVLQELQNLIAGLRPSVLDNLGLVPALRGLVKEFQSRLDVSAQLVINGPQRRLLPELETVLFRISQEALTNVAKHAQARAVNITLAIGDEAVALEIQDDGCGFDPDEIMQADPQRHWGLLGIEERVTLVGGDCQIFSQPGFGTTIRVVIPFREEPVHVLN